MPPLAKLASRLTLCGLAVLLLLQAGCQSPPSLAPQAKPEPAALAAEALARRDFPKAAALYRRALEEAPQGLSLHYGLAVAASHLDRKDEAIREFRWVVERGTAGSPEVESARRWLASAGALPSPFAASPSVDFGMAGGAAALSGQAAVGEPGQQPRPAQRMRLMLVGQPGSPTKEERHTLRTDESGRFEFRNVVPGPYMLTDRVAGPPTWRLRVELQPGQQRVLDLTPTNSLKTRDDFPEKR